MSESLQNVFHKFRSEYPVFCFENFAYTIQDKNLNINFTFSIGNQIHFRPQLIIPARDFYVLEKLTPQQLDVLIFHIGMIELISYWKCTCSPQIIIKPYALTEQQIAFWKKLYFNGLGEFFYLNRIETNLQDFVNITSGSTQSIPKQSFSLSKETIVPIGGGKDSVVTLEVLRNNGMDVVPMIINPRGATIDCITTAGFQLNNIIEVQRILDPKLLELNAQGFLNGHTPFSAMLAFVSLLCSALSGKRNIALSNESSANEATVENTTINHQYSKSLEFETDFRNYVQDFISADFNYFSFLRPLNELQIARLFSQFPAYFNVFKSCNAGSKTDVWCGSCAKCMFVYCILSPFIESERLQRIFNKDLFNDENMQLYFNQLIGLENEKPFECVGTVSEVNAAIQETIRQYKTLNKKLPLLLQTYTAINRPSYSFANLLHLFENNHLEDDFKKALTGALN